MDPMRMLRLESAEELRARGAAWDDLWWRSEVTAPVVRAESIALWLEAFAAGRACQLLAVEQRGRLLAALPLMGGRLRGVVPVARLTGNAWCQAGDLLLDAGDEASARRALEMLAGAMNQLPWPLLCFDAVPLEAPRWRAFRGALERAGLMVEARPDFRVGQVALPEDWATFESAWSKNHRHKLRRLAAKLLRDGGSTLERPTTIDAGHAPELLRRAHQLEDGGWKGAAGTSVLRVPRVLDFYGRLASQLAAWDQLEVAFLQLAGQPIAFGYGYRAKGVASAAKIGYVESAAAYSPVHVLLHELLRQYHADAEVRVLDFVGPLQDWTARWATTSYPVGRLLIAPRRPLSRALFSVHAAWRRRSVEPAAGEPGSKDADPSAGAAPEESAVALHGSPESN
jgi:CelD/BcsL family acetyltransferase involved in cellulose biosynthesis